MIGILTFATIFSLQAVPTSKEMKNDFALELTSTNTSKDVRHEIISTDLQGNFLNEPECKGNARCISGLLTRVIDGDTIVVGNKSIRFSLVNTPEWGDYHYSEAKSYIETTCPVDSKVLIDEDDGQKEGSFGRIIGKVYCNEKNLNEEILEAGYAEILTSFCPVSEFASESWAQKFGC